MSITTPRRWAGLGAFVALATLGAACGGSDDTRTVTAVDYRFEGLPESVDAGTTLEMKNDSAREAHEMVLVKLPDTEQRSVEDLVRLPESEIQSLFAGPPAAVLLAAPGSSESVKALGDGTLTEKGRYLVICSIPIGADPAAILGTDEGPAEGPPDAGGGAPHFTQGMYGEITVR